MLSLRPYQQAAIGAIYAYFEDHKGNPLIVIPTAGGKSLVLAAFSEGVLKVWPDQRILIVTHVRELIAQNHAEMIGLWPEAPAGIYSAGLGRREADARILFAGIQSVHRRAVEIGHCDLVLIDEGRTQASIRHHGRHRRPFLRGQAREVRRMSISGLCAVCNRQARNHGWFDAAFPVSDPRRDASRKQLCSRLCQDICHGRKGMIDPTPNEKAAMDSGGRMGGEYLESIGKTNLAALDPAEWDCFIEAVVTGYCDHLRNLAARDRARLDTMNAEVPF